MAKLYPPNIEGTIPAFTGTTLVVPFSMNRAVGASEVKGLSLKVKKVNTTEIILTKETTRFDAYSNFMAYFDLEPSEQELFNIGQYYRVQLAYIDSTNTIGYYSTVGVIKYTSKPIVTLVDLDDKNPNIHLYDYIGSYVQEEDPTEKLYSSQLILRDSEDNIVYDSGIVIHTVLNDTTPNEGLEYFYIPRDLDPKTIYKIKYYITTINGLEASSITYRIIQKENDNLLYDTASKLDIKAVNNFETGSVEVKFAPKVGENIEIISGTYVISRAEAKEPLEWKKIRDIGLKAQPLNKINIADRTVEQGKEYYYALQQYNNYGIYTARNISNKVMADFEDTFLLDGKRQLKIRFNPKVSSMKNNILETKVNTIGSKYPFITRNGRVNHKEFSLSGLISYQMDDNREFYSWEDLGIEQNITDLITENIKAERVFKLEVLEWLTNPEPKILKTPVEGNYIVKLMGVSLSPNDTLGRMLHTFSCTASEIAPFEYTYLNSMNFINTTLNPEDTIVSKWQTISLTEKDEDGNIIYKTGELLPDGVTINSIRITDMMPGSCVIIDGEPIYIGATHAYFAEVTNPVSSIVIPEGSQYSGTIIYEYKDRLSTKLDNILSITLNEIPCRQFIGNSYWKDSYADIMRAITDTKVESVNILLANFFKRGIHKIYAQKRGNTPTLKMQYYMEGDNLNHPIDLKDLEQLSLYQIYWSSVGYNIKDVDGEIYYFNDKEEFLPYTETYYDPASNKLIEDSYDIFDINVNGDQHVNLQETEELNLKDIDFSYLSIGDGILAELTYLEQVTTFSFEEENAEIVKLKAIYLLSLSEYWKYITSPTINPNNQYTLERVKSDYKNLVDALEKVIIEDLTRG